jgi:hypothetical protein
MHVGQARLDGAGQGAKRQVLRGFFSRQVFSVPDQYPAEHRIIDYITWFFSRQIFFGAVVPLFGVVTKGSGKGFNIEPSLLYGFPNFSEGGVLRPACYFSEAVAGAAVLGPAY